MKYLYESFSSIDQMLRTLDSRSANSVFKGKFQKSHDTEDDSFFKTSSYEDAVSLIRNGWDEPVQKLDTEVKALQAKANVHTQTARPRNSVVGYAPCVPAAILGLPESMIASERVPKKVKAISIIYANSNLADTSASAYIKAGAVVLKMVNDLELKGYRVNLVCEFRGAILGDEICIGRVAIKDWRQPIDLKKIAFPIAHPSMQRRFGFRLQETMAGVKNMGWVGGYGCTAAREWKYDAHVKNYKDNSLLKDNEYYITMPLVKECGYDASRVMKKAGISL